MIGDREPSARQTGQGRRRGFLGEMREAARRGSAGRVSAAPPAGRAERLGLAAPDPAASQAEALPSRIVHAGHRHMIGSELAGRWHGRAAVVFDLHLVTDYGSRNESTAGAVTGRFHVAAVAVRAGFGWWAMTRQDIREHLPAPARSARLPGTRLLERVLVLADPGAGPPVPPAVVDWVGREVAGRRIGRFPLSALELAGQWAMAALPVASLERSDTDAAALASRLGRAGTGPWPEQLLAVVTEFGSRLESARPAG
jgi:hypothetical protein